MDVAGPLTSSAIEGIKQSHNRDTAGAFTSGKLVLLSLSQDAAPQTDPAHLSCQSSLALVLLSCPSFYQHLPRASHSVKCIPKIDVDLPSERNTIMIPMNNTKMTICIVESEHWGGLMSQSGESVKVSL